MPQVGRTEDRRAQERDPLPAPARPHFRRSDGTWLCESWCRALAPAPGLYTCEEGPTFQAAWAAWLARRALSFGLITEPARSEENDRRRSNP